MVLLTSVLMLSMTLWIKNIFLKAEENDTQMISDDLVNGRRII